MPQQCLGPARVFMVTAGYVALFFAVQYVLHRVGMLTLFPDNENLVHWDAAWYQSIAQNGYVYWQEQPSNCGFFFFFPLVWQLTGLFPFAMSILNGLFFATGVSVLSVLYPPRLGELLVWISVPSMFFMFVPYAEALFFLLSAVCLLCMVRGKVWGIWLSLFLLSLTRANAIIFLPVFTVAEVLADNRHYWLRSVKRALFRYAIPLIAGMAFFVWYQYSQTGIWLVYYKLQAEFWGRQFSLPAFPLTSTWGRRYLWLNGFALFTGLPVFGYLLRAMWLWYKNEQKQERVWGVSLLFLCASFFLILFFNPKWGAGGTSVFGAHRYLLAGPFFLVFLRRFAYEGGYRLKHYLLVIFTANAFWLLFGSYQSVEDLAYFNIGTLVVVAYMLLSRDKARPWAEAVIIAGQVVLQVWMFRSFLMPGIFPD